MSNDHVHPIFRMVLNGTLIEGRQWWHPVDTSDPMRQDDDIEGVEWEDRYPEEDEDE